MSLRQSLGNLRGELEQLLRRKRPLSEHLPQRLPLHVLHRNVGRSLVLADVVDSNNVGVVEGGCGAGLLLEASQAFRVSRQFFPQHLDGHVPPQLEVFRSVDFSHPPEPSREVIS